ncbi:MAG: glycosyltransferase family 4 protein [Nitrospirota bacterium]
MKIYFAQADFGGCGFYRILQPAAFLKFVMQHEVKIGFRFQLPELLEYDLIVFQRQYLPQVLESVNILRQYNKKTIYEIDDDLWHVPPQNESSKYWEGDRIAAAEAIMHACDAVTTSTEPLADLIRPHNKNVHVIPNFIPEVIPLEKFNSIIRVGWTGSISHIVDFSDEIIRALKDIKKKYKERVELVFCGWIPEGLVGQVTYYEPVPPMHYLYFLNELRLHIGIMPCADIKFNQCKSNLKFLEYSITKTASIASAIYPYVTTMTEDTGILIKQGTYDEWYEAIDHLVQDADLRKRLSNSAYETVRSKYLIMNQIANIDKVYREICGL